MAFRLHHIGHLVRELPKARESLVKRFGYVVESEVIEDPVQTAFVQFLRLPGDKQWLELVTPNGPESKLTSAASKGEGLHHLCYEVADLEAACMHLRDQRLFPIGAPVTAVAFPGRRIAWFMDQKRSLVELVEIGDGPLSLSSLY